MTKDDIERIKLECGDDTDLLIDTILRELAVESLYAVNDELDKYPFMGPVWHAINKAQLAILKLFPKDIKD